jgi:4-diphosphocytidyl-2-C-methyl-D-erythritol kinase
MDPVTLTAPAKLTLRLKLVGRREDGYHLIEAEMVTLRLADVLSVGDGDALTIGGPFADAIPTDDRNLVRRALAMLDRRATVHIDKQIPAGGGLGGGSADAAAILRWAGCLDLALAARLGADVPFCVIGGQARVAGIGEVVTPIAPTARRFTLCIPPLAVSTPSAYRAWDDLGGPVSDGPNDLEAGAIAVEPRLGLWRDRFAEATGVRPTLAGSGATWFVAGEYPEAATAMPEATVILTSTDI